MPAGTEPTPTPDSPAPAPAQRDGGRGLNRWRLGSFFIIVTVDAICGSVNLWTMTRSLWRHESSLITAVNSLAALACLVTGWVVIWTEQRVRVSYATREAYAREQDADTKLKEMMLRAMEATGDIGTVLQVGGPRPRKTTAH